MNDALMLQAAAALVLLLLGWLAWRRPGVLLALALASLAVRPQLFYGGPDIDFGWSWHHTLVVIALVANAVHFGVRTAISWPVVALFVAGLLTLAFGTLHPDLTYRQFGTTLAVLILPWCFTQVVLEPGSRRLLALAISTAPLVSVVIGPFVELVGMRSGPAHSFRLEGALGNPEPFAILAFAGFTVALHESTRPGRPLAAGLAVLNLVFVILSGTRMAIFASGLMLILYLVLSADLRGLIWRNRLAGVLALVCVSSAFALYWPTLEFRMFGHEATGFAWTRDPAGLLNLSQRGNIWQVYVLEWQKSPWFGRGPGSGFIAAGKQMPIGQVRPHNEYVHLLSSFGVIGLALIAAAIVAWYRQMLRTVSANDRVYLIAVVPPLATLAITEDVLVFATALALYAYSGVMLTRGTAASPAAPGDRRAELRAWAERRRWPI